VLHSRLSHLASGAALLLLLTLLAAPAEAQRLSQYARAAVDAPQVLARGGAGVALPSAESALFYNPAHLARLDLPRVRVEVLGVQGAASTNFFGNLGFLLSDVRDAVDAGFGLPLTADDRALFDEALDRGARPTVGQAALALPVVMLGHEHGALGFGVFATNTTRYRFDDIGGGVPLLDLFSQADVLAVASGAARIPDTPLAAGITTRLARRYIGSKFKDLLAMDPDHEQLYVISGTTLAVDLGLHAHDMVPSLPGRLDLGLAVYDLLGGGFSYGHDRSIALTGNGDANQGEIDRILAAFDGRDGSISARLGAAYHLDVLGPLADASLALDWVSASSSESQQPFLAGLRLGAEATVASRLALRAGIGQGYPAGGFGVVLPGMRLDYSLYGVEDGRLPGQLTRYTHLLQLRVGIF
jgi:hypothetical protein